MRSAFETKDPVYNKKSTYSNRKWSVIYFIQGVNGGPIKMGMSYQPEIRLKQLQTGYPYKLQIIFLIKEAVSYMDEFLQEKFSSYKLLGEWYSPEIIKMLDKIEYDYVYDYNKWLENRLFQCENNKIYKFSSEWQKKA